MLRVQFLAFTYLKKHISTSRFMIIKYIVINCKFFYYEYSKLSNIVYPYNFVEKSLVTTYTVKKKVNEKINSSWYYIIRIIIARLYFIPFMPLNHNINTNCNFVFISVIIYG